MSKSGPIGKVEAFYIEHNYKTLTIQELSEDLNRKVETIQKYIKNNFKSSQYTIRAGDHFTKSKGSVIMTETASMLGDATKKRIPKSHNNCVTKIKHD
jgi:hypothetical protein